MAFTDSLGQYKDIGILLMRGGLGIMMMVHGFPKLAGGIDSWDHLGRAMGNIGIHFTPVFWGFMSALTEAIGGLLITVGLFTRLSCIFMIFNLIVAVIFHFSAGQGINEASHAIETGFAFVGLLFLGAGAYSLDSLFPS